MEELISIIIPVYKVEKYLDKCIDSVVNQTYTNLEILIVDDGSPDNCPGICDKWASVDARITVIHKKNEGLSSARNAALDIAKGQWIFFLDSDDYLHTQAIQRMYITAKRTNADIVSGLLNDFVNENEIAEDVKKRYSNEEIPIYKEYSSKECIEAVLDYNRDVYEVFSANKLYKYEIWKNLRFEFGLVHEDEEIVVPLLHEAKKTVYTYDKLYFRLVRDDSIANTTNFKKRCDKLLGYKRRMDFIEQNYVDLYEKAKLQYIYALLDVILDCNRKKIIPDRKKYRELVSEAKSLQKTINRLPLSQRIMCYYPKLYVRLENVFKKNKN